jgi:hypothetical protein
MTDDNDPGELGGMTGSEDEHAWTPEEMLDALSNRPASMTPAVVIRGGGESPDSAKEADNG